MCSCSTCVLKEYIQEIVNFWKDVKWKQQIDETSNLWDVFFHRVSFDSIEDPEEDSSVKWVFGMVWVSIKDDKSDGENDLWPENLVWNVGVAGVYSKRLEEECNVENASCGQPSSVDAESTSEEEIFPPLVKVVGSADVQDNKSRSQHDERINQSKSEKCGIILFKETEPKSISNHVKSKESSNLAVNDILIDLTGFALIVNESTN